MTKRFTIDEHSNLNKLDDNLKEEFYIIANGFDASQLCDLLNGLNEENKQLKRDFLFKDELIQQLEKTNLHLNHELRLKNDKVLELEKENEQLKSENIELTVDNKELKCANNELYQENEQLKKKCEYMEDVLNNQGYEVVFNGERWVIE